MQESNFEDQQLIAGIKETDNKAILELYKLHRDGFFHWAEQSYSLDEDQAADVFQDSLVALHNNVISEQLSGLPESLKNYLYAIGNQIILKKYPEKASAMLPQETILPETLEAEVLDKLSVTDRQQFVANFLETFEEPCKTILRLFYFKKISMEEIAKTLNFEDVSAANKQKLRCMSTLKKMVRERFEITDF